MSVLHICLFRYSNTQHMYIRIWQLSPEVIHPRTPASVSWYCSSYKPKTTYCSTKTPQTQQPFTKRRYTKEDITKSRLKKNSTQQRKHLKIIENLAEQSPYFPHKICSTVCLPFLAKWDVPSLPLPCLCMSGVHCSKRINFTLQQKEFAFLTFFTVQCTP